MKPPAVLLYVFVCTFCITILNLIFVGVEGGTMFDYLCFLSLTQLQIFFLYLFTIELRKCIHDMFVFDPPHF
jgi:hypothetical protein